MSLESLINIHLNKNGLLSDKWSSALATYENLFSHIRNNEISLLEIGIQNGGSLETWSNYFHNFKTICGIDINKDCEALEFSDPRISVVIGDSSSQQTKEEVLKKSENFDIIIDDGGHQSENIILNFCRFFPQLNIGGLYIVEDLCCGYWPSFGGGIANPTNPWNFFFACVHIINHEHWSSGSCSPDSLINQFSLSKNVCSVLDFNSLSYMHSIEFKNSMCIIKKLHPSQNFLGQRLVSGNRGISAVNDLLTIQKSNQAKTYFDGMS